MNKFPKNPIFIKIPGKYPWVFTRYLNTGYLPVTSRYCLVSTANVLRRSYGSTSTTGTFYVAERTLQNFFARHKRGFINHV